MIDGILHIFFQFLLSNLLATNYYLDLFMNAAFFKPIANKVNAFK